MTCARDGWYRHARRHPGCHHDHHDRGRRLRHRRVRRQCHRERRPGHRDRGHDRELPSDRRGSGSGCREWGWRAWASSPGWDAACHRYRPDVASSGRCQHRPADAPQRCGGHLDLGGRVRRSAVVGSAPCPGMTRTGCCQDAGCRTVARWPAWGRAADRGSGRQAAGRAWVPDRQDEAAALERERPDAERQYRGWPTGAQAPGARPAGSSDGRAPVVEGFPDGDARAARGRPEASAPPAPWTEQAGWPQPGHWAGRQPGLPDARQPGHSDAQPGRASPDVVAAPGRAWRSRAALPGPRHRRPGFRLLSWGRLQTLPLGHLRCRWLPASATPRQRNHLRALTHSSPSRSPAERLAPRSSRTRNGRIRPSRSGC